MECEEPKLPAVRCMAWLDLPASKYEERDGKNQCSGSDLIKNEPPQNRGGETENRCPVPTEPSVFSGIEVLVSELLNYDQRVDGGESHCEPMLSEHSLQHLTRIRSATAGGVARGCGLRVEFHGM